MRYGDPLGGGPMLSMPVEERFWSKVDRAGGPRACWPWTSRRDRHGYGHFKIDGQDVIASRIAWTLTFGPIPDGLCALHHCDNPPCQNPTHLFLGTDADNAQDKIAKGRDHNQQKTHCPAGHPYDEEHAYFYRTASGGLHRQCRTCILERYAANPRPDYFRQWRAKRKAA